ncbi:hypothetical protein TIFTF001_010527 [Ficus carica]|uniref:Cytochrome P450 n=1 Tax=Ficus carica TaxID=3494 RepID=A0AA88D3G5_FICCA|nr:hypothetical protein TIFTF001_010527 [Ficus carica]
MSYAAADIGVQDGEPGAVHRRAGGEVRADLYDPRVRRADGVLGGTGDEPVHIAERREAVRVQLSELDIESAGKAFSASDEGKSPQENALSDHEFRKFLHYQRPSLGRHRPPHPPQLGLLVRPYPPHGGGQEVKQLMSFDPGEWTESLRKEYLLLIEGFFTIPFPLFSTTYRRAIKARTKVAEALRLIVRKRRKTSREGGEDKENYKDMLAALLAGNDGFSDEEIVDFLLALLVAGYETTSTIMTLAVKFLTETPLALSQLKPTTYQMNLSDFDQTTLGSRVTLLLGEEHDQIRAKKRDSSEALEWSDYKSMPFTQCVVNETLRIANIISGVFRRAMTDINIKGYTIPKGWKVFASFRAVHLEQEHFKDARSFNPWRWQNNSGGTSSSVNVFTPFGGGPRLCPGYELARVELSVFLHHLTTGFSWVPAEEDKLVFFPTTRTQKRYPIIVQRRNPDCPC